MAGGRAPKTKGDGYERELAAYLNANVFGGREQVARAILSGSLGGGTGRGIGGSDLTGAPLLYVEAKRTEKLRPQWSLVQAFTNAAHGFGENAQLGRMQLAVSFTNPGGGDKIVRLDVAQLRRLVEQALPQLAVIAYTATITYMSAPTRAASARSFLTCSSVKSAGEVLISPTMSRSAR